MVNTRQFTPEDYMQVQGWGEDRDVEIPPLEYLPHTGVMVDNVAVGFLYLTNSAVGILEGYISNPKTDKNDRNKALNSITLKLIELAKLNGCKVLKCDTRNNAIAERAKAFEFKELGQFTTFIKEF